MAGGPDEESMLSATVTRPASADDAVARARPHVGARPKASRSAAWRLGTGDRHAEIYSGSQGAETRSLDASNCGAGAPLFALL